MSGMWKELTGQWKQWSGTGSGTFTLPAGASILQLVFHASGGGGTLQILDGPVIITPANDVYDIRFQHLLAKAGNAPSQSTTVQFTGATTIWMETVSPQGY